MDYSAACSAREAFAGFGAPTRSRRSDSDNIPPNAISTGPHQIKQHQRLVIDAHRERAVSGGIAERNIELAGAARQQCGFGRRRSRAW